MRIEGEFRFGFVALTDAAPLIVADRLGLFAAEGLSVSLDREVSWATVRDKLAAGLLDGAHIPAQIVVAARLGLGGVAAELIAPLALNVNGAGVTLSAALLARLGPQPMATAAPRALVDGGARPTFGVVFPFSTHAYLLRDWLARGGIDPDAEVRLVVLPPTAMVERMAAGELDGFCVGAPWNAVAELQGLGRTVAHAGRLDPEGPDKVFAVGEAWAARNGQALQAALRALRRAADWADAPDNVSALIDWLAAPDAVDAAPEALARVLVSIDPDERLSFSHHGAGRPRPEHARRIFAAMRRWGQVGREVDLAGLDAIYTPALYDLAQT